MEVARPAKQWFALEIVIDRSVEDNISSALWELGTLGIMTAAESPETITLMSYFDHALDLTEWRAQLVDVLAQFDQPAECLHKLSFSEVPDEDWLKKWKEGYQPFNVGARFLVTPSWAREQQIEPSRVMIEIDPGMAFGTGTHETTRLCLEAIERNWHGNRLLDVGTGTGILAIGAAKLYPESVIVACDNDAEAIMVARENLEINRVEKIIQLEVGSAANYRGGNFSLIVANLTADVIIPLLDDLIACLGPDGRIVLSGILDIQQAEVTQALIAHQQDVVEINQAGEWISIISKHHDNRV